MANETIPRGLRDDRRRHDGVTARADRGEVRHFSPEEIEQLRKDPTKPMPKRHIVAPTDKAERSPRSIDEVLAAMVVYVDRAFANVEHNTSPTGQTLIDVRALIGMATQLKNALSRRAPDGDEAGGLSDDDLKALASK